MKERTSTITRKGQVTIPVEIRQALALKEGDKVFFEMENGSVRLTRSSSVVDRTAGVFKSTEAPLSAKELRAAAEEAIAQDVVERMEA